MNILITQVKNQSEANSLAIYAGKFNAKAKIFSDEEWEDYLLGLMIDEAELEGGEVPRSEIAKIFKRNGINF